MLPKAIMYNAQAHIIHTQELSTHTAKAVAERSNQVILRR